MAANATRRSEVLAVIRERKLRTVFQPIVELPGRSTVGYEALARGPRGSDLEMPGALFGAAARDGVLADLDRACRRAALESAQASGLSSSQLLFLNAEPAAIDDESLPDLAGQGKLELLPVVIEMTERALMARPSEVLGAVRLLRERSCRIALDDVGADRRSLALMPFLAPDVIKLDIKLTQGALPAADAARVLTAVGAEVERSGAVVLAEGIENEGHLQRARAMGATLGQGWLFGRPARLPDESVSRAKVAVPRTSTRPKPKTTPFDRVAAKHATRPAEKELLVALSQHLEREASTLSGEAVVVSLFQRAEFFDGETRRRYEDLAKRAALVCALGPGMSTAPGRGVRGASLAADDPLNGEWIVAVIGPHFAAVLVAREAERGSGDQELFEHCVTYDRALVVEATDQLLARVVRSA